MPAKIMLTIVFDYSTDFSKAFNTFRGALVVIRRLMFVCSYLHSSELHAQVFDKLIRALTVFEMVAWIVGSEGVADTPATSHSTVLRMWQLRCTQHLT